MTKIILMEELSGRCLCSEVTFTCSHKPILAGHCYCLDCQEISGAGHASNIGVPKGSTKVKGTLHYHEHSADTGNIVKRGFCPNCACDMYIENSGIPDLEFLRAGSLGNPELFKPQLAVYECRRMSWDAVDPSLTAFEKMPPGL